MSRFFFKFFIEDKSNLEWNQWECTRKAVMILGTPLNSKKEKNEKMNLK